MTRAALLLFAAWLLLPPAAQAQPSVLVDPDSPAGTEYAIPLEEARRNAAPGEERGRGGERAGGGDQPLFGVGIERAPRSPAAGTGNGDDSEPGGNPRDRRASSDKSDDGETPEALETARERGGSSVPVEATAGGGSEALATAGIAGLVLAGGLAVGFGLRRLLRSE